MTSQECRWKYWVVMPVSIQGKSGNLHRYVRPFIGKTGYVVSEAKNGMLLVRFHYKTKWKTRAIPASCLIGIEYNPDLEDALVWREYEAA